ISAMEAVSVVNLLGPKEIGWKRSLRRNSYSSAENPPGGPTASENEPCTSSEGGNPVPAASGLATRRVPSSAAATASSRDAEDRAALHRPDGAAVEISAAIDGLEGSPLARAVHAQEVVRLLGAQREVVGRHRFRIHPEGRIREPMLLQVQPFRSGRCGGGTWESASCSSSVKSALPRSVGFVGVWTTTRTRRSPVPERW